MTSSASAVAALAAGAVVGIPTETVYGLAVDPLNPAALRRLKGLKGRDPDKPIALLGADLAALERFGHVSDAAVALAERHWPGPLTLVVTAGRTVPEGLGDSRRGTIGLRVPDHPIALELLALTGPLAVTSANIAGSPEALDDAAAGEIFGREVAVFLPGAATRGAGSTVVDMTVEPPVILRQGPLRLSFR